MGALDGMNVKIGADLSGLYKGAAEASKVLSDVGATAAQIAPSLAKSAAAADALEVSLSKMAAKGNSQLQAMADRALGISPLITNLSRNVAAFGGGVTPNKIPDYFKKVGEEAITTGGKLETVSKGVARSTTNYTGLSRILQDLPFGFVAISNNLTEILPAAGAAGLAISAIVSAVTFASIGFSAWTRGLGNNKEAVKASEEAVKKAKEETLAFKDSLDGARAGALSTGLSLRAFVDIARDGNKPLSERNEALKEANKILGEHGDKLTIVNVNTKAVTDTVNKFTEALIQQAIAAKYADRIADLTIKQTDNNKAYNKTLTDRATLEKAIKNEQRAGDFTLDQYNRILVASTNTRNAVVAIHNTNLQIKETTNDFNASLGQSVKLMSQVGDKAKDTKKQLTFSDVVKSLEKELRGLNGELEGGFIDEDAFDKSFVSAYQKAIKSLNEINAPASKIAELQLQVDPIIDHLQIQKQLDEALKEKPKTVSQKDLFLATDAIPIKLPVDLKLSANTNRAISALTQKLKDDFNDAAKTIQKSALDSGLANLGDTIGEAIAGGNVADAFRGLLNTVISGMKQLGEAMIALGTAKIALEKFNLAPGIGTVVAGIGVIALSSIIQSALPKFAGGVTGFGGGLALVGERGPEMVRLPQGSDVIPNHRLNSITGGGVQVFIPSFTLRGADIRVAFNRSTDQSNRYN